MKYFYRGVVATIAVTIGFVIVTAAQKTGRKTATQTKTKQAVFSVINDGTTIEPIAFIENGKLVSGGGDDASQQASLAKTYYKKGAKFDLIFGGVSNGSVTVTKSNVGTECGGSSASASFKSTKAKLKGFVMALAVNFKPTSKGSGLRRMPTANERAEIDSLVRSVYANHKVPAASYKQLHYQNLTAVDVDNDGVPEFVGSYWLAPKADQRDLLFFIAEKGKNGKLAFTYSDYQEVTSDKVMSGDLKDIEKGIYQPLLLDLLDVDNDGTAEVFTLSGAFEGNNYAVFKRSEGKWTKVIESYDYRCGY